MKTPQPTKEELVVKLAKAEDSALKWAQSDERLRKEFAKAFNWVENSEMDLYRNHVTKTPQLPSWEQIFAQLGRLLVAEESQKQAKEFMGVLSRSLPVQPK